MTAQVLLNQARAIFGQRDSTNSQFSDGTSTTLPSLLDFLNEWYHYVIGKLDEAPVKTDTSLVTVTDQVEYSLPTDNLFLHEVYLVDSNSKKNTLPVYNQDEMDERFGSAWQSDDSGAPVAAFRSTYGKFGLHPKPDSTNSSLQISLLISYLPTDLALTDSPSMYVPMQDTAIPWLLSRMNRFAVNLPQSKDDMNEFKERFKELQYAARRFSGGFDQWRWG